MGRIFVRTTWRERLVHAVPIFAAVYLLAARVVISRRRSSHVY